MNFSSILKELREKRNYTQDELGKLLNLSKNAISHYENDTNRPSFETLEKLADIFDVSVDYLLGRTSNNVPYTMLTKKIGNTNMTVDEFVSKLLALDNHHSANIVNAMVYAHFHNNVYGKKG